MNKLMLKLYVIAQALKEEHGGDMIEYVLIGGVVALGATVGMATFASDVSIAFTNLGSKLNTYS